MDKERLKQESIVQSNLIWYNFNVRINKELETGSMENVVDVIESHAVYVNSVKKMNDMAGKGKKDA
jgi:hypothetical protein